MIVIEHQTSVDEGYLADWLPPHTLVRPHAGDPLPSRAAAPMIVLGGEMNAYADDEAPWLPRVRALMADAASQSIPCLGICLGAQLLAVAIGGVVTVGHEAGLELGPTPITATDAAATDPLFQAMPPQWWSLASHSDGISQLPAGSTLLATSPRYPQAFRIGESAWGVQFHPEATRETFTRWARNDLANRHSAPACDGGSDSDATHGADYTLEGVLALTAQHWEDMRQASETLIRRFAELAGR